MDEAVTHSDLDLEREGLLEGCDPGSRDERLALVELVLGRGASLQEAKRAVEAGRLPMLAAEMALAGEPRYTLGDLARLADAPAELLLDVRRAMGLARPADDERTFSDDDLRSATILARLVADGFPPARLVEALRVFARGLAPAARAIREALAEGIMQEGDSEHEIAARSVHAADHLLPLAAPLLQDILRLQLLEQVRQEQNTTAGLRAANRLPGARDVTVCFADLVGFTRLGERLALEEVERVVAELEELASDVVEPPVRLIKTIGDAVMLVAFEPAALVATALTLVERADQRADEGFPRLRAGLAAGTATNHGGDWYGPPVNLASRVTAVASPGEVVCTSAVRRVCGEGFAWTPLGDHALKGIEGDIALSQASRRAVGHG